MPGLRCYYLHGVMHATGTVGTHQTWSEILSLRTTAGGEAERSMLPKFRPDLPAWRRLRPGGLAEGLCTWGHKLSGIRQLQSRWSPAGLFRQPICV